MNTGIQTRNLTKIYGTSKTPALKALSIEVKPGEVYGFLGANGAGKTTAIRLLLDFLKPSSGSAKILGLDTQKNSFEVKRQVGYLAGDVALYTKPTGRELLDLLGALSQGSDYRAALEQRFAPDLDKPIAELSKGNRQKLGIIQAFMHEPKVLILDEPTSGLDPLMQEAFYQTVAEAKDRGAAILMSSHNLSEAQRICDRIGIIKHGRLIHEQPISNSSPFGSATFKVSFESSADFKKCQAAKNLIFLSATDKYTGLFKPKDSLQAALKTFSQFEITDFSSQAVDLEDEFLEYYMEPS